MSWTPPDSSKQSLQSKGTSRLEEELSPKPDVSLTGGLCRNSNKHPDALIGGSCARDSGNTPEYLTFKELTGSPPTPLAPGDPEGPWVP